MNFLPLLTAGANTSGSDPVSLLSTLIVPIAMFAFMWFILIRPQRKRQKEMDLMQNDIKVGDPVLLHSGMYGKVVDTVNNILIVELGTNKSVRVPVQRTAVSSVTEPDLSIVKDDTSDKEEN